MTQAENKGLTIKQKWLLAIAIAVFGGVLLYDSTSIQWSLFWFFTFFGIALFSLEPIPNAISAILLMFAFVISGIAPPKVVFASWTGFIPWVMFAGLCIGAIIEKTGFAQRLALLIISKMGKTPFLLFLSFLVAGYIMNLLIADIVTNVIVLGTFGFGVCKALNLSPSSKASTAIMISCYFAGSNVGANFYPNNLGIVAFQMLGEQGLSVTWTQFFVENFSVVLMSSFFSLLIPYFYARKEIAETMSAARQYIQDECTNCGKMSADEIRTLILLVLAVLAVMLEPYHGLPGIFLMSFIVLLAFCPPFNLLDKDDFAKLPFGIIFFIVGCLAIGFAAAELGIPKWFATKLLPILSGVESSAVLNVFSYFIAVLANFILTPLAAASTLSAPMADLAVQLGFSAKPVVYSFLIGLEQWLLPYEAAPALFLYATGYMRLKYILTIMTIRIFVTAFVIWLNTVTVWSWMGM